jgi:hypothetical protein
MTDVARAEATELPEPSDDSARAARAADVVDRTATERAAERAVSPGTCACPT